MKKIILSLFAVAALAGSVSAQPAFSRGYDNRSFTVDQFMQGICVGDFDDYLTAWVIEGKKQMKQVVLLDRHLEMHNTVTLPGSDDMQVLTAGVMERSRVGVLLVDRSKKNTTMVLACEVNVEGKSVTPYDTVAKFEHDRKDICLVWGSASPDGHSIGYAATVVQADKKSGKSVAAMFDNRVKKLWEKEFSFGILQDVIVTDEGRMVTFGFAPDGEETKFTLNVINAEKAVNFDARVKCDPIKEMHMVNVIGNYAVAVGTFQPADRRNAEKLTAGVVGISFRIDEGRVVSFTMRPFQNEDVDIFLNAKTKKIQKDLVCERISTLQYAPVSYGGVVALGRVQRIETTRSGSAPVVQSQQMGVHMVAIDTSGHVRWVRNFRCFDSQKKGDEPMLMGIVEADGKLCVLRSENVKEPAIYDIAKPAKKYTIGGKGNMALYTVSPQGDVEKFILEKKGKYNVMRAVQRQDGKIIILAFNGKFTRAAEMLFQH